MLCQLDIVGKVSTKLVETCVLSCLLEVGDIQVAWWVPKLNGGLAPVLVTFVASVISSNFTGVVTIHVGALDFEVRESVSVLINLCENKLGSVDNVVLDF